MGVCSSTRGRAILIDCAHLEEKVNLNLEWIRLTHGILYYKAFYLYNTCSLQNANFGVKYKPGGEFL